MKGRVKHATPLKSLLVYVPKENRPKGGDRHKAASVICNPPIPTPLKRLRNQELCRERTPVNLNCGLAGARARPRDAEATSGSGFKREN